jgi:glycosyltransferase involved in cell wall biosynthesis
MNNLPYVSLIIPCRNEENFIEGCLRSIFLQDYPKDKFEVILVDGDSTDKTIEKASAFKNVKIISNIKKIVPISMNIGIEKSSGLYIIRIDVHCEYPKNYIYSLVTNSIRLNSDNIGAVIRTLPVNDSLEAKSIAIAISHPLGVGNSFFRVGSTKIREVDTVPFGCYRRDVFDDIGFYDEDLIRNQDDELNARLIQNGGRIILLPDLVVNYYSRDKINKVCIMFFQYGLYKPLVNSKLRKPGSLRQFIPLFFVIFIIIGFFLSFINLMFLKFFILYILIYLFTLLAISLKLSGKNFRLFFLLPVVFFSIHFSYGWGYLIGLKKIVLKEKFNVEMNR